MAGPTSVNARRAGAPPPGRRDGGQIAAGIAGVLLAFGAIVALAFAGLFATWLLAVPDLYGPEREYAFTPDSWGDVRWGLAAAAVVAAAAGLIVVASYGLLRWAAVRRRPKWRLAGVLVAVPVILSVGASSVWLFANRADARPRIDCDEFVLWSADFRSADRRHWEPQARGLNECPAVLRGKTHREVRALLGAPTATPGRVSWTFHDDKVLVRFSREDGRVLYAAYSPNEF